VRARAVAPDDPLLLSVLAEPRAAGARVRDSLWVRLVDLPEALRSRTYAADVDVVLEVVDERAPVELRSLAAHRRPRRRRLPADAGRR
jgi:predicted acetyltransferase